MSSEHPTDPYFEKPKVPPVVLKDNSTICTNAETRDVGDQVSLLEEPETKPETCNVGIQACPELASQSSEAKPVQLRECTNCHRVVEPEIVVGEAAVSVPASVPVPDSVPVKRGRGRPKKNPDTSSNTVPANASAPVPMKHGRGRPRKNGTAKMSKKT